MKFQLFPSLSTHISSICDNRLSSSGYNSSILNFITILQCLSLDTSGRKTKNKTVKQKA